MYVCVSHYVPMSQYVCMCMYICLVTYVCVYVCMYVLCMWVCFTMYVLCITKYGSTLYIGMDEVLAHYACTFEISELHFHFQ